MYRPVLFLVAVVLFGGVSCEEDSKAVNPGESTKSLSPAEAIELLHPYPVDFLNRGKNYTFYCVQKLDFFKAWRKCKEYNQQLATIESDEENLLFKEAMGGYAEQVFTSGTDLGKEGNYVWLVNQRPIPGWNNFVAWDSGEPNNDQGNENCLSVIIKGGRAKWNDIPCSLESCYMCQQLFA